MSLINKMLIELERRQPAVQAANGMHLQLHGVLEEKRNPTPRTVIAISSAIVACGLAAWWYLDPHAVFGRQDAMRDPQYQLRLSSNLDLISPGAANAQSAGLPAHETSGKSDEAVLQSRGDANAGIVPSDGTHGGAANGSDLTASAGNTGSEPARRMPVALSSMPGPDKAASVALPKPVQPVAVPRDRRETAEPVTGNEAKPNDVKPALAGNASPLEFKEAELTSQQRAENEYRRAAALIQQGRSAESLSALENALQLDPQHLPAFQTLIGVLIQQNKHDEAMQRLQERLSLDRSMPALAMTLARLQVDKNEVKAAIETLQKSLTYAAHRADYEAFLAALYQREGRNKDAVELYLLALKKQPQNGIWWMGLGISLQAQNRLPEARGAFRQAKESSMLSAELRAFVEQKITQLQ